MSTLRANAILDSAGGNTATINGITPIAQGMTLLGTLTTTSGTTQTLSGLVLTNYKQLVFEWNGVSHNGSSQTYRIGAGVVTAAAIDTVSVFGRSTVELATGIVTSQLARVSALPASTADDTVAQTGYSTATTSVSVSVSGAGPLDGGSVRIYGVQ